MYENLCYYLNFSLDLPLPTNNDDYDDNKNNYKNNNSNTMGPNGPKLSSGPVSLECLNETL